VLYAFGGAGPVHAFGFAAELGVPEVVIPLGNGASTLSAYGIASADSIRYFESECLLRAPLRAGQLAEAVSACEEQARVALLDEGFAVSSIERTLLMRYTGQYLNSLHVRIADGPIDDMAARRLAADFARSYERVYGQGARIVFQTAEVFAIRLKVTGDRGFKVESRPRTQPTQIPRARHCEHEVFWPDTMRRLSTTVVDGTTLDPTDTHVGPALIELPHTTVAVAPGQHLTADAFGNLVLKLPLAATKERSSV
jgi:N-methylhydantoinase A